MFVWFFFLAFDTKVVNGNYLPWTRYKKKTLPKNTICREKSSLEVSEIEHLRFRVNERGGGGEAY